MTGIGGHQSPVNQKDEWLTPPHILAPLGPFWLDPCAPIKRPWPTALSHYTIEGDGLSRPWSGRVWLNPPYGRPEIVTPWMRRMVEHGEGTALIFARTETDLFFETVWNVASAVLFIRSRLHFHHVNGDRAENNAGAPSVLVAYGNTDAAVLRDCGIAGRFVRLR